MHMADALISPAVGGAMWAATACLASYAAKKVQADPEERKVPLMGVVGAFVFAAQMINFTIPGTGSSGHLGGGVLLALLLGPHAAFLTIASILTVQALFFADGGLLALGCNIINMGFWPCYVAYPLIYKPLAGDSPSRGRLVAGALAASVLGLQAGAFSVVVETLASGISELPFATFALLMQPIHLAIGLVEGLVTAAVVSFLHQAAPHLLAQGEEKVSGRRPGTKALLAFLLCALLTGGLLSWFASPAPDGLEWSLAAASGREELEASGETHEFFASLQEKIAFLPDYSFKNAAPDAGQEAAAEAPWPAVDAGKSTAGIAGSLLTLLLACGAGKALRYATKH